MKFSVSFLATVLNAALAVASPVALENQVAEFDIGGILATSASSVKRAAGESIKTLNWAGASKYGPNITSATTTATVPDFRVDPKGGLSGMAIYVAIDGYFNCPSELLAAGIILAAQKRPDPNAFTAFWRWLPGGGGEENQITFPISAGDKIRLTVTINSAYSTRGTVENLTTGQTAVRDMGNATPLCGYNASWIVARYLSMGAWMPWADFTDPVVMTDTSATTASGETLNLDGADLLDIEDPSLGLFTKCNFNDATSLTCAHA